MERARKPLESASASLRVQAPTSQPLDGLSSNLAV